MAIQLDSSVWLRGASPLILGGANHPKQNEAEHELA